MITDVDQLYEEVQKDLSCDKRSLQDELLRTPVIMNKYLKYHYDIKMLIKKCECNIQELLLEKMQYYSGKANTDVYKHKPFNYTISNQKEMERYLSADEDVNIREIKLAEYENIRDYLYEVISNIKYRNNAIASIIELTKFESGE